MGNGNGESCNNSEWLHRNNIEFINSKITTLLQLRYQLAFVIISVIAVIWTILGGVYSQRIEDSTISNDIFTFIFLGTILTIVVVTIWRFFTHFISEEERTTLITSYFSMYKLKNLKDFYALEENCLREDTQPTHLEKALKLDEIHEYQEHLNSFGLDDTKKDLFRIYVLRKNQKFIPDKGLIMFDNFICFFFIALAGCFIGYLICGSVYGINQDFLCISRFSELNLILSLFGAVISLLAFCSVHNLVNSMTPSSHQIEIKACVELAFEEVMAYNDSLTTPNRK